MHRINLFKDKEINEFDSPPILTNDQRGIVLTKAETEQSEQLFLKWISRMGFIFQHEYFILQIFFSPTNQG